MANATLVITITSPRSVADLARFIEDTSNPRNQCRKLAHFFQRAGAGDETCSFYTQTSATEQVRASSTLTLTYASISNNDTCVIGGTTLTCVTGTPSGGAQFKKETDAGTTAANLVACVNANSTLKLLVFASKASGVVTIKALAPGVVGNQIPLVGSTGMVAGAAVLASGAGGHETVPVTFSRGL